MRNDTWHARPSDRSALRDKVTSRVDIADMGYDSPCWISNRVAQPNGYTKLGVKGRTLLTHRVAYEAFVGPIPDGLMIDHLCRVRACCNPAHLEPVDARENLVRGDTLTAHQVQQTHCLRGHPLSGENLYLRPDRFGRMCRECRNMHRRAA